MFIARHLWTIRSHRMVIFFRLGFWDIHIGQTQLPIVTHSYVWLLAISWWKEMFLIPNRTRCAYVLATHTPEISLIYILSCFWDIANYMFSILYIPEWPSWIVNFWKVISLNHGTSDHSLKVLCTGVWDIYIGQKQLPIVTHSYSRLLAIQQWKEIILISIRTRWA
jgi:hypothetical protein